MAQKTIKADVIKQRTDTTDNWESKNPILAKGEIGIEETTTGEIKQKVGDGTSAWDKLVYLGLNISTADKKYLQSFNPLYPSTYVNWNTDFLEVSNGKYSLALDPNFTLSEGGINNSPCLWAKEKMEDGSESATELSIFSNDINLYDIDGDLGYTSIHGIVTYSDSDPSDAASKMYVDDAISSIPSYTLPIASTTTLGGIIVGDNLTIDSTGKLSASTPGISQAVADARYLQLAKGGEITGGNLSIKRSGGSISYLNIISADTNSADPGEYYEAGFSMSSYMGLVIESTRISPPGLYYEPIEIRCSKLILKNSLNNVLISGVLTPVDNTDATNKEYVDTAISNIPTYSLPTASTSTLGGVKIGANVTVAEDGTISVAAPGISQEAADAVYMQKNSPNGTNHIEWNANNLFTVSTPYTNICLDGSSNGEARIRALDAASSTTVLRILASELNLNFKRITNVKDPTADSDAATKNYVDSTVASVGNGLPITNPSNSKLTVNWTTSNALSITNNAENSLNKRMLGFIVNDTVTSIVAQTPTGDKRTLTIVASSMSMQNSKITDVAAPTNSTDVATKAYVDSRATSLETSLATLSAHFSPVSNITYTDNSPTRVSLATDESVVPPIEVLRYIFSLNIDFSKNLTIEFDIENVSQYSSLFIRHEVNNVGHIINSIGTNSLTLFSAEQNKEISVIDYTITAINDTDRHYKLTIIPNDIFKQNPYYIDVYGVKTDL